MDGIFAFIRDTGDRMMDYIVKYRTAAFTVVVKTVTGIIFGSDLSVVCSQYLGYIKIEYMLFFSGLQEKSIIFFYP